MARQDAPPSVPTVREATTADAATLVAIVQGAFFEYLGRLDPPSSAHAEAPSTVLRLLQTEHALIAQIDGQAAGCVFFAPNERSAPPGEREIYVHRLGVLPPWRHMGVGSLLMSTAEAWAAQNDFTSVALGVRIALPATRAFHEERGYRVSAYVAHAGYSHSTAIVLRKKIGVPQPRQVVVSDWSPTWPEAYEQSAVQLRRLLDGELLGLFHVGSTAVRDLASRPTIDLLAVVRSLGGVERRDEELFRAGWHPLGAAGNPPTRLYKRGDGESVAQLLHVVRSGHPEIGARLALVAFLNSRPEELAAYSELKCRLAQEQPWDLDKYDAEKGAYLQQVTQRALSWWQHSPAG